MTESEFPTVTAHAIAAMQHLLALNIGFRREMATGRRGAQYMASLLIETRLIMDAIEGQQTGLKRLAGEVAPEWVSETSVRRIVREVVSQELVQTTADAADRRAVIVMPTRKLAAKSERRWGASR
jgi:hypothetical protein